MRSFLYLIAFAVLGFAATWAYSINYETREVVTQIDYLKIQIKKEREKLLMLEGEWAYLNRPDRLAFLVEKYFHHLYLMPLASDNFADIETIDFRYNNNSIETIEMETEISSVSK